MSVDRLHEQMNEARRRRMADVGELAVIPAEEVTPAKFYNHGDALRLVDPLKYAAVQNNLLVQFVRGQMVESRDYGVIPGTSEKALFKAGAERLANFFNYSTSVESAERLVDYEKELFAFTYKAVVRDRFGRPIAECEGHCNSREKKYRYRWVPEKFANDDQKAKMVARKESSKYKGTFDIQVPNHEIYDQVNTIMKMAQKRALVGAVILACNASNFFRNADAQPELDLPDDHVTWETVDAEVLPEPQIINDAQRRSFWTIASTAGYTEEAVKAWLASMGIESTTTIEIGQYELLCRQAEQPSLAKFWNEQVNEEASK